MSKTSVLCITKTETQAARIVDRLKAASFSNNDISVLFPDKRGTKDFAHEQHTKAPEGATTGGVTGGILGGALGWLVGIGALAIPGVGPFIAAGPIMAALGGAAVGGAAGGIVGALMHTENSDQAKQAKEIFKQEGAEDISSTGESTPPKGKTDEETLSHTTTRY
jgi:hypothetical protein